MVTTQNIVNRLEQLGYTVTTADEEQVSFELKKITNYVMNYCNITTIPEILDLRIIDRVCSEFINYKKNSGTLVGFDYDAVIRQISEGDTTISYAVGQGEDTPENRFDAFVNKLERGFDKWITPYRKLRW